MKVFEFTSPIILVLGDDYLKNYWICNHMFFKIIGRKLVNCHNDVISYHKFQSWATNNLFQ